MHAKQQAESLENQLLYEIQKFTRTERVCSGPEKELAKSERNLAIVAPDLRSAKFSYKMLER